MVGGADTPSTNWSLAIEAHFYLLWLENPAMNWVGRLSYSLYLWQELFLIPGASYPFWLLQRFPINLGMVFLMAVLSYELVEWL